MTSLVSAAVCMLLLSCSARQCVSRESPRMQLYAMWVFSQQENECTFNDSSFVKKVFTKTLVRKIQATPLLLSLLLQLQLLQEQCKKKKSSTTTVQEQIVPPCRSPQLGVGGSSWGANTKIRNCICTECPIPHISFCPTSPNGRMRVSQKVAQLVAATCTNRQRVKCHGTLAKVCV